MGAALGGRSSSQAESSPRAGWASRERELLLCSRLEERRQAAGWEQKWARRPLLPCCCCLAAPQVDMLSRKASVLKAFSEPEAAEE